MGDRAHRSPCSHRFARVLLADDEALARMATVAMLESLGCEVRAVHDGTALIDALAEGELPDIIVSDLAMPGLGGVGLVQTLDALRPDCPLLLITGFSGEDVAAACTPRLNRKLLRKPSSGPSYRSSCVSSCPRRDAARA